LIALDLRFWSPRSDSNRRPSDYESKSLRPAGASQSGSGCSAQRGRLLSAFLTCRVTAGGMTKGMTRPTHRGPPNHSDLPIGIGGSTSKREAQPSPAQDQAPPDKESDAKASSMTQRSAGVVAGNGRSQSQLRGPGQARSRRPQHRRGHSAGTQTKEFQPEVLGMGTFWMGPGVMCRTPPRRSFVAINDMEFSEFFASEFAPL
jgi:hypothetical protein